MSYRELTLRSVTPDGADTEIMYEIAGCRVDSVDIFRLNINDNGENPESKRLVSSVIRLLRNLKQKGTIQFFATRVDFISSSTEAIFLQNKYPDLFDPMPAECDGVMYIFVKI